MFSYTGQERAARRLLMTDMVFLLTAEDVALMSDKEVFDKVSIYYVLVTTLDDKNQEDVVLIPRDVFDSYTVIAR